jgi:hypothetical protein
MGKAAKDVGKCEECERYIRLKYNEEFVLHRKDEEGRPVCNGRVPVPGSIKPLTPELRKSRQETGKLTCTPLKKKQKHKDFDKFLTVS